MGWQLQDHNICSKHFNYFVCYNIIDYLSASQKLINFFFSPPAHFLSHPNYEKNCNLKDYGVQFHKIKNKKEKDCGVQILKSAQNWVGQVGQSWNTRHEASSEESVTKSRPNPFTTGGLDHVLALSITTRFNNLKGNLDLDED